MTGWLAGQTAEFRARVQVVATDGFGGYRNVTTSSVPTAVTVMDPFYVVALAGTKLDLCRQRVQQDTLRHRGRSGDPLYRVRRALRTRAPLLTVRRQARISAALTADEHVAVEATWRIYQQIIAAYPHPDPRTGGTLLARVIDTIRAGLPAGLDEPATPGRTLHRRRADVLAHFTHQASNGPTEAVNGRLEAPRRNALGFRNLINYRIRPLLHCGALALQYRKNRFALNPNLLIDWEIVVDTRRQHRDQMCPCEN